MSIVFIEVTMPPNFVGTNLCLNPVSILSVNPPLLSDHAFVVAGVECTTSQGNLPTDMRTVRNWRSLDVDMLVSDLCSSGSVATG